MSMLSEQVKELRKYSEFCLQYGNERRAKELMRQAANTIEALSAKLRTVNMENGGGWILVDENNLPKGEVLGCNIKGSMMVGKIKKVKDGDIRVVSFFPFENGMMDCIAYMPLPESYCP